MNDTGPLVFFYDYVDPSSYLMEFRLRDEGLAPGSGLLPLPFELNPPPGPLLDPRRAPLGAIWKRAMQEADKMGLGLKPPSIVPWSRKAHELAFHAADQDSVAEIHEALFRAYLIEGRDIGRVDVLTAIASEHGLDAARTKAALDVDKHVESLENIRAQGVREGVSLPCSLLFDKRLLYGPQALDDETFQAFLRRGSNNQQP